MSDPAKAIFLSYASQDADAVKKICDALRAAGVEVWFDAEGGLEHGDEWDAKIRRQIKECVLFLPIISANTQAREEGYFRIEWELAAQRALGIASGVAFILPVVIDGTREPDALVPDRFRTVQWTKLPGGNVPPEVLQRLLKLWSHRSGALKHAAEAVRGQNSEDSGPAVHPGGSAGSRYAVAALAVLALGAGFYFALRLRRSPGDIAPMGAGTLATGSQAVTQAASVPPSQARQLAARARAMSFDKYDSTADDFTAADGLLKRALELDPNDAEIWAVSSQLNKQFQTRGFDRSSTRAVATLSQAQRAVKLDPDSIEAQFALGFAERGTDPAAAEQIMRRILARQPDHPGALFAMSNLAYRQDKVDESLAYLEKAAAQPKWAALAGYLKYLTYFSRARFGEADQAIRQSIAVQPSANSVAGLAMVLLTWKGDADAAARMFAEAPTTMRNEPRTVWMTAQVQLCRRAPDEALNVLDRLPDEFIQDSWFAAPKAYYVGRAQALAGRPEAARVAWETGLAIVQTRLKVAPANAGLHLVNGELLALLGRDDEALREARTVAELSRGERLPWFASPVRIYAELGRADDALPLLAALCPPKVGDNSGWPLTPALLRLDPLWDRIRADPRFQKLCAEPPAAAGARATDWPHDPDLKRAIMLIDSLDATLEDYRLADEISARAVEKAPADPEAVTVRARVDSAFITRNFDFSDERTAQAKRIGERAVQLAPDEPNAYYALSIYLSDRAGEEARAEALARKACELAPDEPRFRRQLMRAVLDQRPAEGLAMGEDLVKRFPRDVLAHYELSIVYRNQRKWEEFERETDATLALAPLPNAINWKARAAILHYDLPAMRHWIDQVPARQRSEERTMVTSIVYAALSGDYEFGLKALQGFGEPWFYDTFNYAGPAALPRAMLFAQEGKAGLAREQYEAALTEIVRHRKANPTDQTYRNAEIWTLLGLGRLDEARPLQRTLIESLRRPHQVTALAGWWFDSIPRSLLLGDRDTALQLIREAAAQPEGRQTIRQRMQVDARMAPFRDDPEIAALLAGPAEPGLSAAGPAALVAAGPAAVWPKDPDLKRAMRLIDSTEAIASDVVLAEDLVKAVLAARPTDTEATLAMGRVQVYFLVRGFDRSEERFATAKRFAERAMALSPDDPEAMVVMATYLYRRGVELPQAGKLLRQAIALRPTNPFYYRMLDNVLSITPSVTDAEVIASARVTAERFPQDALVQYELARHYRDAGMLEEAEHYLDIAIRLGPVANAIIARARLVLMAHGDPAGMKALLDQLPERYRATDRAVFSQFTYALATQQPQLGLDALQVLPDPWMIDFDYTGPTALLAGELLLQQGKAELARLRFTEALAELGRHKADFSRNFSTTWLETWLLMRLGRLEEAHKRNDAFFPEVIRPYRFYLGTNWWFNPINLNLLLGDHAKALALMREGVGFQEGRTILRNAFRFDPRMAPFRADPEVKTLLAEPEARK